MGHASGLCRLFGFVKSDPWTRGRNTSCRFPLSKQLDVGDALRGGIEDTIEQIAEKYFANPIDATVART